MKKRVLFVSIAFPPKSDPECIQAGRYFETLSTQEKLVIDVITSSNPTLFMPVDSTLREYADMKGQLIELPIYESRYTNFILRKISPNILSKPDSKMTFHWQWRKAVNKLKNKPNVIYSRSYPLSSAIMGLKLANYFRVPWVLHLSDPWVENALHSFSPVEYEYHSKMEKICFERASLISFTSEKTSLMYKKKYSKWAQKFLVFPNVYNSNPVLNIDIEKEPQTAKLRIVYTGGLANTRTSRTLLEALNLLFQREPSSTLRLEVLFAGDLDRKNQALFKQFKFPFVNHIGLVSLEDALALQRSADLLVVIDSEIANKDKAVFFPSKLLDYAALRKPILAITDKGSVTEDFVINQGGICFAHNQTQELSDWLKLFADNDIEIHMKPLDIEFGSNFQALRLAEILDEYTQV